MALVTGGSIGIGRMIAEGLAVNGCRVYITSRKLDACEAAAGELNALAAAAGAPLPRCPPTRGTRSLSPTAGPPAGHQQLRQRTFRCSTHSRSPSPTDGPRDAVADREC